MFKLRSSTTQTIDHYGPGAAFLSIFIMDSSEGIMRCLNDKIFQESSFIQRVGNGCTGKNVGTFLSIDAPGGFFLSSRAVR